MRELKKQVSGLRQQLRIFIKVTYPQINKFNTDLLSNGNLIVRITDGSIPESDTVFLGRKVRFTKI